MRPVTRGARPVGPAPPAYPYDIRLDTRPHLQADLGNYRLHFYGAAIRNVFGTNRPTLWQLLVALTQIAIEDEGGTAAPAGVMAMKGRITDRLATPTDGYKPAGPGLLARIGPFCSYCEQHLPGQIAVEHCIPKAPFPLVMLCWQDFLFGCEACNGQTGKSDNPSRGTVIGWGGGPNANDVDRYNAIRARYFWPDIDANSYRALYPCFKYRTGAGQWQELTGADAVFSGMAVQRRKEATRRVKARIQYQGNWYDGVEVTVHLRQASQHSQDTVPYYGLDRPGTATTSIADRRMYNRTLAWFQIVNVMRPFTVINDGPTFEMFWPGVIGLVPTVGFFSVWVRVLDLMNAANANVPGRAQTIMDRFLTDAIAAGYVGTNRAQLP